ncbi:DUF5131 family protein, partial [Rhodoblastus acidophilus]|uniref:DUF5131 family protein n=1 Tax=Rhodoblastus acidophilus TaxID=1074 RepID=UPI000DBC1C92
LRWRRPRKIFVNSMGDLFHESVPDEWIDRVFAVMALAPQHTFQILTKRAKRMRDYLFHPTRSVGIGLAALGAVMAEHARNPKSSVGSGCIIKATDINPGALKAWPLPNVWLGVTAEDQARADERIPDLLATPAAKRFISAEPLLSPLDVRWALGSPIEIAAGFLARGHFAPGLETLRPLDQIITGGESGPNARPSHPDWFRSLRDQCA